MTAYMLVFAWADIRHKDQTIRSQEYRIAGAESIAQQMVELMNRYGVVMRRIR